MLDSRAARAVLAAAFVLGAAACGGSDFASAKKPSPGHPPATAASTTAPRPVVHRPALRAALLRSASMTRSAHTARTSVSVTVTGLGDDEFATGAFDVAGTGSVDLASGDADLALSVPLFDRLGGGGAIEERIVDGVAYARLPAGVMRVGGLPPAVRWLRIDMARGRTAPPSALSQSQLDPAGQLAFLGSVSDDVRRIGVEAVRDTRTTHYAATIAFSPVQDNSSGSAVTRQLGPVGARLAPGRFGVDVWIDAAGLTRRIVVSVRLSDAGLPASTGADPVMRIQADFYAFGVPVRVIAPPPAQVRPYAALRLPAVTG